MKNIAIKTIEPKQVTLDGVKNVSVRMLVSKADGAPNFSMRLFELEAGGHTLRHKHDYEHVVYIIEGKGKLHFEGADQHIEAGHAILLEPGKLHQFMNTGDKPMKFLCLIPNGEAIPDKMK